MNTVEQVGVTVLAVLVGFFGNRVLNWFSGKRDVRCDVHDCQAEKITRFEDGLKAILDKVGDLSRAFDDTDGVWIRLRNIETQIAVIGARMEQFMKAKDSGAV